MKNKIVLADDHQFLLEGIMAVLKDVSSIDIVATANNGIDLMKAVSLHKPQLVVLDLNMPGYDGLQCLQKIKAGFPETKVLVLTNYSQPELIEEVKKMKADGFLVKNSTTIELKKVIENILSGIIQFPAIIESTTQVNNAYFLDDFLKKYQLTKREVIIIRMICQEMSTKEIAGNLFLSELTVTTHRRNILRKLEVKNVAGLMNFAKINRLV